MDYKPGDTVYAEFGTTNPSTGAGQDADSTPVGTMNHNGSDDATSITVTHKATGRYVASWTIPTTYVMGDVMNVSVAATVNSIAGAPGVVWSGRVGLGLGLVRSGVAQAGGNNTITLDSGASASNSAYPGFVVMIVAGTGANQRNLITSYVGTTKIATVAVNWPMANPDSTSVFAIVPAEAANLFQTLNTLSVGAAGYVGTDQAQIANPTSTQNLTNTTIKNLVGNTVQTGDVNALATNGTYGLAALQAILTNGSYGLSALQTLINNLNNLSALANLYAPTTLVRPSSGSIAYPITLAVHNEEGGKVDMDTNAVTLTAANAAGTDRSSNLSSVTHSGTGEYVFTYTVQSSAVDEGLSITAAGTVNSSARKAYVSCTVADADSLSALAAIESQTNQLSFDGSGNLNANVVDWKGSAAPANTGDAYAATESLTTTVASISGVISSIASSVGAMVNAIGGFSASGANTIKGFLLAMMRSDATLPSDVGGTYSASADSLQAIKAAESGSDPWATNLPGSYSSGQAGNILGNLVASGGSGANVVTVTVNDGNGTDIQNAVVRFTQGVSSFTQTTNSSGQCAFSLGTATWTVSISAPGYFFAPVLLTVNGTLSETYSMSLVTMTPIPPGQVTGYLYCYDENGNPESGVAVTLTPASPTITQTGIAGSSDQVTKTSNSNGQVQFPNLFSGASYYVQRGNGQRVLFRVPVGGSSVQQMPSLTGSP